MLKSPIFQTVLLMKCLSDSINQLGSVFSLSIYDFLFNVRVLNCYMVFFAFILMGYIGHMNLEFFLAFLLYIWADFLGFIFWFIY